MEEVRYEHCSLVYPLGSQSWHRRLLLVHPIPPPASHPEVVLQRAVVLPYSLISSSFSPWLLLTRMSKRPLGLSHRLLPSTNACGAPCCKYETDARTRVFAYDSTISVPPSSRGRFLVKHASGTGLECTQLCYSHTRCSAHGLQCKSQGNANLTKIGCRINTNRHRATDESAIITTAVEGSWSTHGNVSLSMQGNGYIAVKKF